MHWHYLAAGDDVVTTRSTNISDFFSIFISPITIKFDLMVDQYTITLFPENDDVSTTRSRN